LRHYATNQKVIGVIPDEVIGFFNNLILPATLWHWCQLSLKQKLVSEIILGVKGGQRLRLTTSPPSVS
jgi:hypothetical protein